jgi:hypothetical protein
VLADVDGLLAHAKGIATARALHKRREAGERAAAE